MHRYLLFFLLTFFIFGAPDAHAIRVVTSFSILGDMVKQIGGTKVDQTVLVGPDKDAHTYEPTPADIRALSEADLLIINGLKFEGWMGRLIESSSYKGPVIIASKGVRALKISKAGDTHRGADDGKGEYDPHAWQSLANGIVYANNICDALVNADKANAPIYKANARLFIKEMSDLEKRVKMQIKLLPEYKRRVITSHDAFQYYGKTYLIQFIAPVGISTEAEPSAADVAKLIDQIREQNIKALFLENISRPGVLDQLKQEGAEIGGVLYSDALSTPEGPAGSYLNMFRQNTSLLLAAMQKNPDK
ncbi:MAG: zinc ABC transporter substrate-binding protein [Rickettsiales bacterium]